MNFDRSTLYKLTGALLAAALVGCAAPAPVAGLHSPSRLEARLDPRVVAQLTSTAASQVRRCYRAPKIARSARQISTRLRVHYAPDGQLATLPVLVAQAGVTEANRAHAAAMAEAAMLAVVRCAPLTLPADLYQAGWDEFELTFSPKTFA